MAKYTRTFNYRNF